MTRIDYTHTHIYIYKYIIYIYYIDYGNVYSIRCNLDVRWWSQHDLCVCTSLCRFQVSELRREVRREASETWQSQEQRLRQGILASSWFTGGHWMGLIIKGTIPRVSPFSLWIMGLMNYLAGGFIFYQNYLSPKMGKIPILTSIFQRGWKPTNYIVTHFGGVSNNANVWGICPSQCIVWVGNIMTPGSQPKVSTNTNDFGDWSKHLSKNVWWFLSSTNFSKCSITFMIGSFGMTHGEDWSASDWFLALASLALGTQARTTCSASQRRRRSRASSLPWWRCTHLCQVLVQGCSEFTRKKSQNNWPGDLWSWGKFAMWWLLCVIFFWLLTLNCFLLEGAGSREQSRTANGKAA